jgi:hypothetical protein
MLKFQRIQILAIDKERYDTHAGHRSLSWFNRQWRLALAGPTASTGLHERRWLLVRSFSLKKRKEKLASDQTTLCILLTILHTVKWRDALLSCALTLGHTTGPCLHHEPVLVQVHVKFESSLFEHHVRPRIINTLMLRSSPLLLR